MKILVQSKRHLYFTVEQPTSSWALKQVAMLSFKALAGMCLGPLVLGAGAVADLHSKHVRLNGFLICQNISPSISIVIL